MPFKNVYFTGIIRDHQGRKMSKSLGNSPDPLDLIEKYGADGLRFGIICASRRMGRTSGSTKSASRPARISATSSGTPAVSARWPGSDQCQVIR